MSLVLIRRIRPPSSFLLIVVVVLRVRGSFEGRYHAFNSPIAIGRRIKAGVPAPSPNINVGGVGRETVVL